MASILSHHKRPILLALLSTIKLFSVGRVKFCSRSTQGFSLKRPSSHSQRNSPRCPAVFLPQVFCNWTDSLFPSFSGTFSLQWQWLILRTKQLRIWQPSIGLVISKSLLGCYTLHLLKYCYLALRTFVEYCQFCHVEKLYLHIS